MTKKGSNPNRMPKHSTRDLLREMDRLRSDMDNKSKVKRVNRVKGILKFLRNETT